VRRDILLVGAVAAALVVVALGADARGSAPVAVHAGHNVVVVVCTLAVLALIGAAVATVTARRLRGQLAVAAVLATVLAACAGIGWLFFHFATRGSVPPAPAVSGQLAGRPLAPRGAATAPRHTALLTLVPVVGGSLIAALLVVAVVLTVIGRRRRMADAIDHDEATRGAIYAAAGAGADAMRDVAEPRAAIIACYAAMEAVLSHAGVRRLVAETPSDLLTRAIEIGVAPRAAQRLTGLFLEARYSTHEMTEADRAAAHDALALLRHPLDLAGSAGPTGATV
jgi:Domain of unknown function (DUF4129)